MNPSRPSRGDGISDKNDRLVVIRQDLVPDVAEDGAGEDDFFEVFAEADEVFHRLAMGDANDVLFDDRAFVEIGSDVVAGGSDDFHTAPVGGMIRPGTGEGGEETVMDVDDPISVGGGEGIAEDLHVAGQDDGVDLVLCEQSHLLRFLVGLVGGGDGQVMERNAHAFDDGAEDFVIADDEGNFRSEFPGIGSGEEIVEAMWFLGNEEGETMLLVRKMKRPLHFPWLGDVLEDTAEVFAGNAEAFHLPFDAHEEHTGLSIGVLVQMHDVAAIFVNEIRHTTDQPGLIRAVNEKDRGGR